MASYGSHTIGVRTIKVVNAKQVNVLKAQAGEDLPTYDRPLTLEVWYPAKVETPGGDYRVFMRDGKTEVTISGRAVRDATPETVMTKFPLIILSHGFPGNRYLLAHLGENLASKGYVVASIDHTDSTYNDRAAFGSTLVNRPLDQKFVLDEITRLSEQPGNFLSGLVDPSQTGLIGYSMGAYGSMITAGAGISPSGVALKSVGVADNAPARTLAIHQARSESHAKLFDPRFKAIIAIAPWGYQKGLFDAEGLMEAKVPIFFMGGSADDVADYNKDIRVFFEGVKKVDRYLLTFEHANHNAAAPMPAPAESWPVNADLGFSPFDHYGDAVWDTVRMNNIAQHFATVWFDLKVKGDQSRAAYLQLVEDSEKGVWATNPDGTPKPEHNYWKGFRNRTAKALKLEHRAAD
ncbi:alpha/beta hydrolase family protein [Rhizobium oryzicola]|uniref:Dienelactone hydrolase n=1 Tax=Rhizobium oryzicola TaxID=1232668 RepID=A0ABT8SZY3_9HYPH|nr:dienelactone hydrolase [Rhizobium oryzicola]MDO1583759.1 dienelactone hydrolase [Rhizobium oryzicola]